MDVNSEYIDVPDALKRIGGSMDLYKRLLNQFTGGDHIDPLEEALSVGALDEASRLIHTLKGVAANLSLIKLSSVSKELEDKLKNGLDHGDAFKELKHTYDETSQQIEKIS
ncbi:MAG: Hpt domain-containing protein [Oscillospiraceae bacterium]|nr:Hpt domain-containing protein [Oscillospiraceae bacterium]